METSQQISKALSLGKRVLKASIAVKRLYQKGVNSGTLTQAVYDLNTRIDEICREWCEVLGHLYASARTAWKTHKLIEAGSFVTPSSEAVAEALVEAGLPDGTGLDGSNVDETLWFRWIVSQVTLLQSEEDVSKVANVLRPDWSSQFDRVSDWVSHVEVALQSPSLTEPPFFVPVTPAPPPVVMNSVL